MAFGAIIYDNESIGGRTDGHNGDIQVHSIILIIQKPKTNGF